MLEGGDNNYSFELSSDHPKEADNNETDDKIVDDEGFRSPQDLFEEVAFFNVDEVPEIMNRGHMLHYHSFLNRLETLYRFLTNSNIDIEVEDLSNLDMNNAGAIRASTSSRTTALPVRT